ncbi:gamma-glutamyltransferase [Glaciecola sp. MH2013]|uniref:gamma-glutamyltransferase n=1 Tax=Glaciecola sp. MH2013 TaxID=2785524 RepID=UPI00189D5518|nr:gamma-glutamyltransferase [Glaciecola sp. MH2013]MBF7072768.1 gamma-glutamyltransferase [Glaciecola sp. MH2013]
MRTLLAATAISLALSSFSYAQVREDREPEADTGKTEKQAFVSKDYMVVTANPYASWAGKNIIEKGGSAIDAAVAIQAMLTLVEPQSSGIGGGAFILYWDNENKKLHTFDGRETAPQSATPYIFIEDGKPMRWLDAVVGGKAVGVPGVLKALEMAHKEFGELAWRDLFEDAINTSRQGFTVSPRLERLLKLDIHPGLNNFVTSQNYFKPNGKPLSAGKNLQNNILANTFLQIAHKGSDYFYKGELATKIAEATRLATINSGFMTADDLANYEAKKREPICGDYRGKKICGMAPPSSGGISVYQILKALEQFELNKYGPQSEEFVHLFTQSSALAFADRNQYIADTDFTNLPAVSLINSSYLNQRAEKVGLKLPFGKAEAGKPYMNVSVGKDRSPELPSTSHFSIVDKKGNAVSMTTSIEFMFGSGIMVEGFLLNNQLTDFSLAPSNGGTQALNRVEANKRPRSSMSPTMLFDEKGNLELIIGSPGGSRIINYVAQTIINVVDFDMDIQEAINSPRITNRNDYTALEKGTDLESLQKSLEERGHNVRLLDLNSGLHGIQLVDGKLIGGADPRREGVAVGK